MFHDTRRCEKPQGPFGGVMIKAFYPGSFDPPTKGHEDLVRRSLALADRVIVAVATNSAKQPLFSVAERLEIQERRDDATVGQGDRADNHEPTGSGIGQRPDQARPA